MPTLKTCELMHLIYFAEFLPVTKTARKINPSAIAKQKLKEALRLRIEFYEFINGRFSQQLSYHRAKTKINF